MVVWPLAGGCGLAMKIAGITKKKGLLLGGSGLIGGALTHHFKTKVGEGVDLRATNSKKLSLRDPEDLKRYLKTFQPEFIINSAIAAIDADAQLAFEINYLGAVNLAKAAVKMGIPYIFISSAATLPNGENLGEGDTRPLNANLSNYAKSKLMAEMSLAHMGRTQGLDYTIIRLGVVYGKHDHKIQGFHRLFFSVVDQAMPVMLTKRGVRHSYSNTKKLPPFIHYLIENREEFSGKSYNFVDPEPVELAALILRIKEHMKLGSPREIYIPYRLARFGKNLIGGAMRKLARIGIDARMPAELMFLENFYQSQTLSALKLAESSYGLPDPEITVFTEIPAMVEYYLARWEHLNLISRYNVDFQDPKKRAETFKRAPLALLEEIHEKELAGGGVPGESGE